MEEQSQVEELQKNLQEEGSKADNVSNEMFVLHCGNSSHISVDVGGQRVKFPSYHTETKMAHNTAVYSSS